MAEKIRVTAAEGRMVPIDRSIATAAGNAQLYLRAGEELEVDPSHQSIVRQMRSGDLVVLVPTAPSSPAKKER
jgi:hypothetical protein